jgi:ATP-binding cassette subfamily C protein
MAAMLLNSLIYLGIAISISWQAGRRRGDRGTVLLVPAAALIRVSRRAGQHQTALLKSLGLGDRRPALGGQAAQGDGARRPRRRLISDQTRQLKRAIRRQVISKEALTGAAGPLLAIMVGVGFFLSLFALHMQLAAVLVMVFLLARVVNYLSKVQRAFQQVVVRESAYWSLIEAIASGHGPGRAARRRGRAASDRSDPLRRRRLQPRRCPAAARPRLVHDSRAGPHGARRPLGRRQDDAARPGGRAAAAGERPDPDRRRAARRDRHSPVAPADRLRAAGIGDGRRLGVYNLALGEEDLGEAEIREALRAADALAFVEADARRGCRPGSARAARAFSGGQRQRLAIARALVHKPRL